MTSWCGENENFSQFSSAWKQLTNFHCCNVALCSWLIVSNSFTSAERRFYLKSIQRFGSTSWTTVLTKMSFEPSNNRLSHLIPGITLSFTAKHVASFVVHCVLCLPLWPTFSTWDTKEYEFLFIFLSNYLISHFPFSAGSSGSSCERLSQSGTYLFCKVSVLFPKYPRGKNCSHCHPQRLFGKLLLCRSVDPCPLDDGMLTGQGSCSELQLCSC